jgi:hypothetical protein
MTLVGAREGRDVIQIEFGIDIRGERNSAFLRYFQQAQN